MPSPLQQDLTAGLDAEPKNDVVPRPVQLCDHLLVLGSRLQPEGRKPFLLGLSGRGGHVLRPPEDVHDIDLSGRLSYGGQDLLPQDLPARVAGVDQMHLKAAALHHLGDEVAGPGRVGRDADHGDGPALLEKTAEGGRGLGLWACEGYLNTSTFI